MSLATAIRRAWLKLIKYTLNLLQVCGMIITVSKAYSSCILIHPLWVDRSHDTEQHWGKEC